MGWFFFRGFSPERHGSNTGFGKADCVVEMLTLRNRNSMCFLMCKSLFCANSSIQGAYQRLSQVKGVNFCGNCLSKYWQPLTKASSLNIAPFEITSVCEKRPRTMQTITGKITTFCRDFSQVYLNRKKLKVFKRKRGRSAVEINCHICRIYGRKTGSLC